MKKNYLLIFSIVALIGTYFLFHTKKNGGFAPDVVPNFSLLGADGSYHELRYYSDASSLLLVAHKVGCSLPNIAPEKGQIILEINAEPGLTRTALLEWRKKNPGAFPVLMDETQKISHYLGFVGCGDSLLIDPKTRKILQRTFGKKESGASPIPYSELQSPVFSQAVVPLLQNKCLPCHRETGVGSWAMDSGKTVASWAPMIREVLLTRRMPPWSYDPEVSPGVRNAWGLSPNERKLLLDWIDGGAKVDAEADRLPALHAEKEREKAEPESAMDYTFELKDKKIQALQSESWLMEEFPFPFSEDKWVQEARLFPSNTKVIHHIFLFIDYPQGRKSEEPLWKKGEGMDGNNGFFVSYGPGFTKGYNGVFPNGTGRLIPKGARGRLQIHYVSTGKDEKTNIKLELKFLPKKPAREFKITTSQKQDFSIPPGVKEYPYQSEISFSRAAKIYEVCPHMHLRGKWMRFYIVGPGGDEKLFFSVPHYRQSWQSCFSFNDPIHAPAHSKLLVKGAFDNSPQNLQNPDPTATVRYGPKTTDEMFFPFVGYTEE